MGTALKRVPDDRIAYFGGGMPLPLYHAGKETGKGCPGRGAGVRLWARDVYMQM